MSNESQSTVATQPAAPLRVPAHTQWKIEDRLDKHLFGDVLPDVAEGDEAAFRHADASLACLCWGVPAAARDGTHTGWRWKVTLLAVLNDTMGLFLVESLEDC